MELERIKNLRDERRQSSIRVLNYAYRPSTPHKMTVNAILNNFLSKKKLLGSATGSKASAQWGKISKNQTKREKMKSLLEYQKRLNKTSGFIYLSPNLFMWLGVFLRR